MQTKTTTRPSPRQPSILPSSDTYDRVIARHLARPPVECGFVLNVRTGELQLSPATLEGGLGFSAKLLVICHTVISLERWAASALDALLPGWVAAETDTFEARQAYAESVAAFHKYGLASPVLASERDHVARAFASRLRRSVFQLHHAYRVEAEAAAWAEIADWPIPPASV